MFACRTFCAGRAALVAALVVVSPFAAAATDPRFKFTTVADTSTVAPGSGSPGVFYGFTDPPTPYTPAIDHGAVVFLGRTVDGRVGVYRWSLGALSVVADNTFVRPEAPSDRFTDFRWPVVSGPNIAFIGGGSQGGGLYLARGSTMSRVAYPGMPAPDGLGTVTDLGLPTLWGDEVSFTGGYSGAQPDRAVFRYRNGALETVVRIGSAIPGGTGTFTSLGPVSGNRGELAFYGRGTDRAGVFRTNGDALVRVAEVFQAVPDNPRDYVGNVGQWVDADGRASALLILEGNADRYSIWTEDGGLLVRRASGRDPVPGGTGQILPFDSETKISLDDNHVAFNAAPLRQAPGVCLVMSAAT
jgi:hypothetical protein